MNFNNGFSELISIHWDRPEEISMSNFLTKEKEKYSNKETLQNFIDNNRILFSKSSTKFQDLVNNILSEADYDGYWESTSIYIYNSDLLNKYILPKDVVRINRLLDGMDLKYNSDSIVVTKDSISTEKIKGIRVVEIPISKLVRFDKYLKKINSNLRFKELNNLDLNIADKINKQMSEAVNIKVGLDNWKIYEKNNSIFAMKNDKDLYESFSRNNGTTFWDKPYKIPTIVKDTVQEINIRKHLKECSTADMAVPDNGIGDIKRKNDYHFVWDEKNNELEEDFEKLEESIGKINLDKLNIIAENFSSEHKVENVLVEANFKKELVSFDRNKFENFIKENCLIDEYKVEGKLDYDLFLESRTLGFKSKLLSEYFKHILSESEEKIDVIDVQTVPEDDSCRITFDDNTSVAVNKDEFIQYCLDNDFNCSKYITDLGENQGQMFDEDSYLDSEESAKEMAELYIEKK